MAQNIYDILNKPVANPNMNGFDLGQFFPFSLKIGQVKPIGYIHTVPKGHYKINVDELTHSEPFITDPFVRISKHIEVVFVPFSQLWRGSEQFFAHSDNDAQSSYENGHQYNPVFSLGKMLRRVWTIGDIGYRPAPAHDMQGLSIQQTALSLLDMLGYGAYPLYNMSDTERTNLFTRLDSKYVNAWNLLAYNKYWNSFLRDSQHTQPLNAKIFNVDCVPCTSVETSIMDNYYSDLEMLELVTIKYRKTKKDLFTSALTSRQFGAVEGVNMNFDFIGNGRTIGTLNDGQVVGDGSSEVVWYGDSVPSQPSPIDAEFSHSAELYKPLDANHNPLRYGDGSIGNVNDDSVNSVYGRIPGITGNGSFDVYTLLTAQMMQKWREQIQRAGNRTDDRMRAVYGAAPGSTAKMMPYLIGSTSYDLRANQVTSTAATEGAKVGDIAAKGIGYAQRNQFEFNATEFGVILICTYLLPDNSYLAPLDKLNTFAEPFDYFVPQVENLGLEQIEGEFRGIVEYDPAARTGEQYKNWSFDSPGFAARNWAYKQKLDVVHLGFEHGAENSKWVPSRVYNPFVDSPLHDFPSNPYYVDPNEYDTVFGTLTDYTLASDQFVGACRISCNAVLPMSVLGIPRW